jgi:hypothetical protein
MSDPRYKIEDEIWHHSTKLVSYKMYNIDHYDESDNLSHTFQQESKNMIFYLTDGVVIIITQSGHSEG